MLASTVNRIGESDVRICKSTINIIGALRHFTGCCQQLFLFRRKNMLPAAALIVQIPAVSLQTRLRYIKPFQLFVRDGHDFGGLKAGGCMKTHCNGHIFSHHCLIGTIAGILIRLSHAVVCKQPHFGADLLHALQIGIENLAVCAKLAGKGSHFFLILCKCCKCFFPCRIRGIQVLKSPGVFHRDLMALSDFVFFHGNTSKFQFSSLYHANRKKQ